MDLSWRLLFLGNPGLAGREQRVAAMRPAMAKGREERKLPGPLWQVAGHLR
jgi:hypothetical protein